MGPDFVPAGIRYARARWYRNRQSARGDPCAPAASGGNIRRVSATAVHKSADAIVDFEKVTARGESLQVVYKNIRVMGDMLNTMVKNAIGKFKNYVRHTEATDQVKGGYVARKADGLYQVETDRTIMVSKKETKIDGERIFMA